tara:strand:- start:99 stop:251 length:153 start_codon:yes stop_codon:yes gene_type:complete
MAFISSWPTHKTSQTTLFFHKKLRQASALGFEIRSNDYKDITPWQFDFGD